MTFRLNKIKIIAFITLLVCSLVFLTGCSSSGTDHSIDDLAYVVGLGIDIGENQPLKISFQIALPSSASSGGEGGGGGSSQSSNSIINTIECNSIDQGINLANSYVSKMVNLSHCKVIVFSEELAYKGISDYVYTLENKLQVRPNCNIIITRSSAEDFLDNSKPTLESLSSKYYEIAPTSSEYTGYTDAVDLGLFFSRFEDTFGEPYAILGGVNSKQTQNTSDSSSKSDSDVSYKANETPISSKSNIENMGVAVFSGGKMVGELTGIETLCHLLITNRIKTCSISIPDPFEDNETIELTLLPDKKTKTEVDLVNGSPYIRSKVKLKASIGSIDKNSNYLNEENIRKVEEYANDYLKEHILSYLYKTSKEYKSDIAGFGQYAVKYFWTQQDWENYNWLKRYKDAHFQVEVDTNLATTRLLLKT